MQKMPGAKTENQAMGDRKRSMTPSKINGARTIRMAIKSQPRQADLAPATMKMALVVQVNHGHAIKIIKDEADEVNIVQGLDLLHQLEETVVQRLTATIEADTKIDLIHHTHVE